MMIIVKVLIVFIFVAFAALIVSLLGMFVLGPVLEGLVGWRRAQEIQERLREKYIEPRLEKWLE